MRAQSIAVTENTTEYSFPSQEEIMQLSLPNASLANISLPSSLLLNRATGEFRHNTYYVLLCFSMIVHIKTENFK